MKTTGYGFAGAEVPELSIGVVNEWRGRRVGHTLMRAVAKRAKQLGASTLSLSVERKDPAAGLYLSDSWRIYERGRDSDTMVLELNR